jgi:hypothetical protein
MFSDAFWDIAPLFVVFPTFYFITKAALNYSMKKKLIEKDLVNEDVKHLFSSSLNGNTSTSLKWGLVLILIGVVAIGMKMVEVSDEVAFGAMLIAAGVGLMLYYFISQFGQNKTN